MLRLFAKKIALRLGVYPGLRFLDIRMKRIKRSVHDEDYFLLPKFSKQISIYDVGANIGQSVLSFKSIYPNCKITAFEPNPACCEQLERICSWFSGDVIIKTVGLGKSDNVTSFFVPILNGFEILQEGSFDKRIFTQNSTKIRIGGEFEVAEKLLQISTIDKNMGSPDIIKIDVQGLEYDVVLGAVQTIERCRPVFIIEKELNSEALVIDLMTNFGYRLTRGVNNNIFTT